MKAAGSGRGGGLFLWGWMACQGRTSRPLRFAMRPLLIGSEIYRGSTYGPKHPLAIPRVSTTLDLIRALGWVTPKQYHESPRAVPEELQRFHWRQG